MRDPLRIDEFKTFLLRGNVVELAVAVIIGLAFTAVVTSLVDDLIMPLVAMVIGERDFSALSVTVNDAVVRYGSFVNTLVVFLIIAAVVFYLVVMPANRMMARYHTQPSPEPTLRQCPECLSDVPRPASRCRYCTAAIEPEAVEA